MIQNAIIRVPIFGRTSHEVRGLKCYSCYYGSIFYRSHLTRGAWIEIRGEKISHLPIRGSHLTRGAWIEMEITMNTAQAITSRTSHEVRGLK